MDPVDKRRFVACLVGGQSAAVLALVVFGGILIPAVLAFVGSGAGLVLLGSPERGASPSSAASPGARSRL